LTEIGIIWEQEFFVPSRKITSL